MLATVAQGPVFVCAARTFFHALSSMRSRVGTGDHSKKVSSWPVEPSFVVKGDCAAMWMTVMWGM